MVHLWLFNICLPSIVAFFAVFSLYCQDVGADDATVCEQFKDGKALIALMAQLKNGSILLLDNTLRGFSVPMDRFQEGLKPRLNLFGASVYQGPTKLVPANTDGRGMCAFRADITTIGAFSSNQKIFSLVWLEANKSKNYQVTMVYNWNLDKIVLSYTEHEWTLWLPLITSRDLSPRIFSADAEVAGIAKAYFDVNNNIAVTRDTIILPESLDGGFVKNATNKENGDWNGIIYGYDNKNKEIYVWRHDAPTGSRVSFRDFFQCSESTKPTADPVTATGTATDAPAFSIALTSSIVIFCLLFLAIIGFNCYLMSRKKLKKTNGKLMRVGTNSSQSAKVKSTSVTSPTATTAYKWSQTNSATPSKDYLLLTKKSKVSFDKSKLAAAPGGQPSKTLTGGKSNTPKQANIFLTGAAKMDKLPGGSRTGSKVFGKSDSKSKI